ncbi:MAG TPA: hypothetical protein VGX92_07815 [Pyrinomonadaceae bacterium]|jgi:tRNA1(Val) A37 N6-methylase TrmN6|nr:hypothetical protein [Pyrinomonadaceae bacterium]
MSVDAAIIAAQAAVAKGEAVSAVDVGAGEASAALGVAQATAAYQLVIQILQDKVVELAPALIAIEVAAISEGIAVYLAEQQLSATIEKELQANASAVFAQTQASYEAEQQQEIAALRSDVALESKALGAVPDERAARDVAGTVRSALDQADAAVSSALAAAFAGLG